MSEVNEPKNVEEMQEKFLDVFFNEIKAGGAYWPSAHKASKEAGYSEKTHVSSIVSTLKDRIITKCQEHLTMVSINAVSKVEAILHDGTTLGAKNVLKAAEMIMDRAGLSKKEQIEMQIKAPDGVVLIPMKNKINKE